MTPINLAQKLAMFSTHWHPHVVASYNDDDIMVVKFQGAFPFHKHDTTDDFFLVLEGEMMMEYEDRDPVTVKAGEIVIVPAGQVHRPRADAEVKVLLIEPKGEPNSGDADMTPATKPQI